MPLPNEEFNRDLRNETELQTLDRNFNEILQELRVAQTGTQILFAFLLTLTFTDRFSKLTDLQLTVYLTTLCMAFLAAGFIIGPVSYHRITFRKRMRLQLVKTANVLSIVGLVFLVFALAGSMWLVCSLALNNIAADIVGAISIFSLAFLWFVLPMIEMARKSS